MVEALFSISEPGESRARAACKVRAAGIDLGTTNSLIAVVAAGEPVCLDSEGGDGADVILPSAVSYLEGGRVVVGGDARDRLALRHPEDTILSVKRFMGRGMADLRGAIDLVPYHFVPAPASDGLVVRFAVAGGTRVVTPIEVSAEILIALRARAELALGGELAGVVITVPAYFDDGQRQATRDAGRLAGLEVMRLLNEPTAAALAYGLDKKKDGTFAVFDLGGGTFDISILKLAGGVFEVKSTGGDSALGGDDFDRAIADWLLQRIGLTAADRAHAARPVLAAARAAKERLTDVEETVVAVDIPGVPRFSTRLSRADMNAVVKPILDRCAAPVRQALRDAGLAARALDGVILVGGATRMPLVRHRVATWFEREPLFDLDPERVVALGAAIQADILAGGDNPDDIVLLDVVPLSLGLEMMGGVAERLIHRNSTVPCTATQTFTTYADNQTGFDLHVVQGEREMVSECRSLARFKLGGIPPAPAGMARLEVTFTVDTDGILSVAARELMTGKEATIQVKPSYGLAEGEVERMLLDSFAHAESDVRTRLLAEQRVEAERILNATRTAMKATPELLRESEPAEIERAMELLEAAKIGTDAAVIRNAIAALDASSKEFAARRMNAALAGGIAGRSVAVVEKEIGVHAIKGSSPHDHG